MWLRHIHRPKDYLSLLEIPKISVNLPIYHGTNNDSLERGVGHLLGSSLPVGGESTHTVLTAHSGMASQRMFSDLDLVEVGDVFYLDVLGETLAYQVDQIKTVLPYDTTYLGITEGKDQCTLVTCTPFGVNTHRLLVHGTRVDTPEVKNIYIASDAYPIDSLILAPIVAAPMLLILLILLLVKHPGKKPDTQERSPDNEA